jgi:hypothetical protein
MYQAGKKREKEEKKSPVWGSKAKCSFGKDPRILALMLTQTFRLLVLYTLKRMET